MLLCCLSPCVSKGFLEHLPCAKPSAEPWIHKLCLGFSIKSQISLGIFSCLNSNSGVASGPAAAGPGRHLWVPSVATETRESNPSREGIEYIRYTHMHVCIWLTRVCPRVCRCWELRHIVRGTIPNRKCCGHSDVHLAPCLMGKVFWVLSVKKRVRG